MKRKITLSIALVVSIVCVLLIKSDSTVGAQQTQRYKYDTGIVTLGPNQILRVTVAGALDLNDLFIRLNRQSFTQGVCSGGVCKLAVASQSTTDPITLQPGEAVSFTVGPDIQGNGGVRVVVLSSSGNVRVNAMLINSLTGEVVAVQMSMQRENQQ